MQVQPDAIAYRNKVSENYIDLCQIQRSETSNIQNLEVQTGNDSEEVRVDLLLGDVQFPMEDIPISDQQRKRPTATPSDYEHSSKVQKVDKEMQRTFPETAEAATTSVNKKESKNRGTIENAIEALQAIADIDEELLLDACDLLEDDKKAKTFLALDATLRKKWLLRKLRP